MSLLPIGREVVAVWNTRDPQAVGAYYGEHVGFRDPITVREVTGPGLVAYAGSIFTAFPDLEFRVHAEAEGPDVVMLEWSQCGTHRGAVLGAPATGRYVEIPAVSVLKFRAGVLQAHHDYWDLQKLVKDLGLG